VKTTGSPLQIKLIIDFLGENPIVVRRWTRVAMKTAPGAMLLSQVVYWITRSKKQKKWSGPGEIWKTDARLRREVSLSKNEFETAKRDLLRLPFIKVVRRGFPAKTIYSIKMPEFERFFCDYSDRIDDHMSLEECRWRLPPGGPNIPGKQASQHPRKPGTTTSPETRSVPPAEAGGKKSEKNRAPELRSRRSPFSFVVKSGKKKVTTHPRWGKMAAQLRDAIAAGRTIPKNYSLRSSALGFRDMHRCGAGELRERLDPKEIARAVEVYCGVVRAAGDVAAASRRENGCWPEIRSGRSFREKWDKFRSAEARNADAMGAGGGGAPGAKSRNRWFGSDEKGRLWSYATADDGSRGARLHRATPAEVAECGHDGSAGMSYAL